MNHVGTKTIETERLILRRFGYGDINSMIRNWIADEKTQWDYGEPYYDTYEKVKQLFDTKYVVSYDNDDYYRWAIIEKNSGECIGQIAYYLVDTGNHFAEVEYVIGPNYQGKGYATEATSAVINYGFEQIDLHKVQICCRVSNLKSKHVIEKCGLTYEGTLRDYFWRGDHYESKMYFSILRDEWEKK